MGLFDSIKQKIFPAPAEQSQAASVPPLKNETKSVPTEKPQAASAEKSRPPLREAEFKFADATVTLKEVGREVGPRTIKDLHVSIEHENPAYIDFIQEKLLAKLADMKFNTGHKKSEDTLIFNTDMASRTMEAGISIPQFDHLHAAIGNVANTYPDKDLITFTIQAIKGTETFDDTSRAMQRANRVVGQLMDPTSLKQVVLDTLREHAVDGMVNVDSDGQNTAQAIYDAVQVALVTRVAEKSDEAARGTQ